MLTRKTKRIFCILCWTVIGGGVLTVLAQAADAPLITFNDDGAWCWFEDERAVIHNGKLVIATVAAGVTDPNRAGNIEVVTYDLKTGSKTFAVLRPRFSKDDHNSPALFVRPDGRYLAMYAKHGPENHHYYRITANPDDGSAWQPEQVYVASPTSRITYTNLHFLSAENNGKGRLYNFFRGLDNHFKPSWMYSDDGGQAWTTGGLLITFTDPQNPNRKHRPYVKYASNGKDTVHFIFTEAHPAEYPRTGIYHACYRSGNLYRSDGTLIKSLAAGPLTPPEATRIFAGDPENIAWTSDIHLDAEGRPFIAYSVRKGQNYNDHRYRYARWDGRQWVDHEIAYAGSRLYKGQEDYTGNVALVPDDPDTVYISTDVDPVSGKPLSSQHFEIFRGVTPDGGATWRWTPITRDSTMDNLRPIVPIGDGRHTVLLWMRGKYTTYTNWNTAIVGMVFDKS
jgi:hypothetical protein